MSNVAEGFKHSGIPEKLHFYNIARASCGEVRSLLYVVEDNYPDDVGMAVELRDLVTEVGRRITGLIASTERRKPSKP